MKKLSDHDIEVIKDLYVNQKKSSTYISALYGVCHKTILRHLDAMGVKRRSLRESHFAQNNKEVPKEFYDYNTMYDMYVTQHMTKEQLGERFNCAPHVIDRVLRELNIKVRDSSVAKIGVQRGEHHHNWKGGITSLYSRCREYAQKNLFPKVKTRDNNTCQLCGSTENLHVHHKIPFINILNEIISEHKDLDQQKDVNKLYEIVVNDSRFLDTDNLITCCDQCHMYKVHGYGKTIRSEAH